MTTLKYNFLAIILFFTISSFAKKPNWQLEVNGKVLTYDATQLKNVGANPCKVLLYQDEVVVKEIINPANSEFSFLLDPNHDYIISAENEGYIKQQILISTKEVPEQRSTRPFQKLNLNLIIFRTYPEYDYSFLQKPLVRICYSYVTEDFGYDSEYEMAMSSENRKMEGLSTIAMKHEWYKDQIRRGDIFFKEEKWDDAKSAYLAAAANLPLENYPVEQVKICNEKLAILKAEADLKDQKYADLLSDADAKYSAGKYSEAKLVYQEASLVHPELFYPKSRMVDCDNGPANDKNYKDLMAAADKLFADRDYIGAKEKYQQALELKPAENFPKTQIAICDKKISELSKPK